MRKEIVSMLGHVIQADERRKREEEKGAGSVRKRRKKRKKTKRRRKRRDLLAFTSMKKRFGTDSQLLLKNKFR